MPLKLIAFLIIGTVLMGYPIILVSKKYAIKLWKAIVLTVFLTLSGTAGTYLMYYVENGRFGGLSFYGAVFFVPLFFVFVSLLLQIPYGKALDLCAVGECIMLALMKVHCLIGNCCTGRLLFVTGSGKSVYFPSRIVEMLVALAIFAVLLYNILKKQQCGIIYPEFLLLYGSTRFVLNIFREAWVVKQTWLPIGNIWSLVSILVGATIFLIIWLRRNKTHNQQKTQ